MADKRQMESAQARPDQGDVAHRWRIHPAVDKELRRPGQRGHDQHYAEAVTKHKKRLDLTPA